MTKVAIVYHSGFGHTKAVAEAVAKGVSSTPGVQVALISVDELPAPNADRSLGGRWGELNDATGIIFGTPTYMGDLSAKFKKFMEDSSGLWYTQAWKDKLAGGFVNSGGLSGDKLNALNSLVIFAGQHSMVWVSTGVMPSIYTKDGKDLNRLSSFLGVMTQSDSGPPEQTPPTSDRETAERFGSRFAQAALRWTKGKA